MHRNRPVSSAHCPPSPRFTLQGFEVRRAVRQEFREISGPFISAFFKDADSLSDTAFRRLSAAAATDLTNRYGCDCYHYWNPAWAGIDSNPLWPPGLRGSGDRALFVARFEEGGDVAACAGVEAVPFDGPLQLKSVQRGSVLRPLVANLAVSRAARRRGLAAALMRECEAAAQRWGYEEAVLLVDARNSAAVQLYRKLARPAAGGSRPGCPPRLERGGGPPARRAH